MSSFIEFGMRMSPAITKIRCFTLGVLKLQMALRIQDFHTFYVVARTGTMQAAAQELNVTPGAISQRIRAIEEQHGSRLFSRSRKGVELTKAGNELWADIGGAFSTIEAAFNGHFKRTSGASIRISAAPTFAYSALVPRLGEFTDAHPKIKITLETDERLVDLRTEPIDIAIRHGLGEYAGLSSKRLSSPELIVVGSPALLAKNAPINEPADCLNYSLLGNTKTADWELWLEAHGVDATHARFGTAFQNDFLIVKAATNGQGIALLSDVNVKDELESGRLVKALDVTWPTRFAYYAVALPATFQRPAIRQFTAWLEAVTKS